MQQITPSISQIEVLLQEYQTKYADKNNMPLDWVSQYKTFQSHNITLENWNTFNLYIHNVLSDTKSSHEFIISAINLIFDTFSTLNANDEEHTLHIEELQAYVDLHKDIFNSGVIYLQNINEGSAALSSLKENQKVLSIRHRTSTYVGGKAVQALQMFTVVNGKYQSLYSVEIDYHDLIIKHESLLDTHSKLLTTLQNKVDSLDLTGVVLSKDLSDVAFSGDYNDLSNKPTIPTQLSELTNNVGFITNAVSDLVNYYKKTETFTKDEITARFNAIKTIAFEIYASLDDIVEPQTNIIYLIGTTSPYEEYAYIEEIGFEQIGSTSIDLSAYVQANETLNTDYVVLGNGAKNIKNSIYKIETSSLNNTGIPTTHLVQTELRKYHDIITINGNNGTVANIASHTPYRIIVDENLLVYRRVKNGTNPVFEALELVDNTHTKTWFLTFIGNNYTRTSVENVDHNEFDALVENTPTDITYNTQTKVAQLTHDGKPIGNGVEIGLNGFTPFFDGSGLVLSDLEHAENDLATKQDTIESVKIVAPITATSGTFTSEELQTLLKGKLNYVEFNNENFYPQDVEIEQGYIVYSHVGQIGNETKIKNINLTIATGGWVLTETSLVSAPITVVNELPTANEENFEKGKIYTTGELLQYVTKVPLSDPTKTTINSLPISLAYTSAAAVGDNVYIFGGADGSVAVNKIYKYSLNSNTITDVGVTFPRNVDSSSAAAVGTDIYIFAKNTIYKYSTTNNTVETMSATLPQSLYGTSAAAVGTDIYVFCGAVSSTSRSNKIYKYSTTNNTVETMSTTFGTAVFYSSAAAVGTDIYIFGGFTGTAASNISNKIYKYSTTTNLLSYSADLPEGLGATSAAAVGTDIYVFCGIGYRTTTSSRYNASSIIKFSTTNNTTTTLNVSVNNLAYTSAAAVGTDIYIFGGLINNPVNYIYQISFGFEYSYKTIATQ